MAGSQLRSGRLPLLTQLSADGAIVRERRDPWEGPMCRYIFYIAVITVLLWIPLTASGSDPSSTRLTNESSDGTPNGHNDLSIKIPGKGASAMLECEDGLPIVLLTLKAGTPISRGFPIAIQRFDKPPNAVLAFAIGTHAAPVAGPTLPADIAEGNVLKLRYRLKKDGRWHTVILDPIPVRGALRQFFQACLR